MCCTASLAGRFPPGVLISPALAPCFVWRLFADSSTHSGKVRAGQLQVSADRSASEARARSLSRAWEAACCVPRVLLARSCLPRIIISGGGTGGHIFPAVSIANAIKELRPDAQILFVGAEGRMEMQRVPDAGYQIIGLPVAGFDRKHLWKNVAVLLKLARSQFQ